MQISSIRNIYIKSDYDNKNVQNIVPKYAESLIQNVSFKGTKKDNRNIFQKGWDYLTNNNAENTIGFNPSCSILDDEQEYLFLITKETRKLSDKECMVFLKKVYHSLKTPKEKALFRQHFSNYLPQEQPQQTPNTAVQRSQNNRVVSNIPTELTKESLLKRIELTEKEDLPKLVSRVAKGTKEEQHNLLETYNELSKKHDIMLAEDPLTIFRDKNAGYYSKLYDEIREELKSTNQKSDFAKISEIHKERLTQIEKNAGLADFNPETTVLGKKLFVLGKQMTEQNISFIPTVKILPEDLADEKKIVDKTRQILAYMPCNEASALDGLNWFEKNGHYAKNVDFSKYSSMSDTILDEITASIRCLNDKSQKWMTDKVLNNYIDIHNKFAKVWTGGNNYIQGDATLLEILFKEYAEIMSKDTAFKFLDSLERTVFKHAQTYTFKIYASDLKIDEKSKDEFIQRATQLHDKMFALYKSTAADENERQYNKITVEMLRDKVWKK